MNIGLTIPHTTGLASIALVERVLGDVDSSGWTSLWGQDHVTLPRRIESHYPHGAAGARRFAGTKESSALPDSPPTEWWEVMSVLAYAAAKTTNVKLGTSILVLPLRHPLLVAKEYSTLDVLSDGRVISGVGVGWMAEEFEALGVGELYDDRPSVAEEYLQIMRAAWEQDYITHSGRFFQFSETSVTPSPIQSGGIPIWIGGNGNWARRLVAQYGDGWMPLAQGPSKLAEGWGKLVEELARNGREPGSITFAVRRRILLSGFQPLVAAEAADDQTYLLGDPSAVLSEIEALAEIGVNHVILDPWGTANADEALRMLDVIVDRIVPLVRTLGQPS